MKLLCEYNDGTTASLCTALQKDPYKVRGLVIEAFFECLAILPDTSSFLRTEHSVRDALVDFEGNEDRSVKPYIVSRFLDSRIKTTPRATVIQSSFVVGGPLTLIGIFYATSNISRNMRNREALQYLLESSTESRNELFERARTFPRHLSTGLWFQQIFDNLEIDAQSLAYFLISLGPHPLGVPDALFKRIRQPSLSWGRDGEIVTHHLEPPRFLNDESRFNNALRTLQSIGLIRTAFGIHIDQQLATLIGKNLAQSRVVAAKVICHTFPKHQQIEQNNYAEHCKLLLPYLQHVFSFPLKELLYLQLEFFYQAIEACLSSLNFGGTNWRSQAIAHLEDLLSLFASNKETEFEELRARVTVAKVHVRQYSEQAIQFRQDLNISFPCNSHRSKAFSAELAILKAKVQMDLDNVDQALQEIASFDASFNGSTSTLGGIMGKRVTLVRGTILRFRGHFAEAYAILRPLSGTSVPGTATVMLQLTAALCETGDCDRAINYLHQAADLEPGTFHLAWAQIHLFKYMQAVKDGRQDEASLRIATDSYLSLTAVKAERGFDDTFSIFAGEAILFHIQEKVELARKAWSNALSTLYSHGSPPGYLYILILASLSDLAFKEHGTDICHLLRHEARESLRRCPSSHRFLGLGSLWPDILYR
ncbi:hypothetical protein F5Y03DRAFT_379243 [Xylaria venustula]|nr:hypothetical protein F5Y03DRAFT_379243 [Xylaria venustula]